MKKQGIKEVKELIDFIYLIYTFKNKKSGLWNRIFGNWNKLRKAIEEGVELWSDKKLLWEQIKDIDIIEAQEINKYVVLKFGVSDNVDEFVEHLIKGTDHYIQAYKISKKFKK